MAKMASRRGAILLTRRFPDLMVGLLATAPADRPGYPEVKWVVRGNGGAPTVRTSGWRGFECSLIDAGGGKGKMGRSIKWSFGVLQLSRETSCVPAAIRECESATGSGSGCVRHAAGNPRSAWNWRHGQAKLLWDLTLRWGKLVGGCCVSSSIGISMCSQHRENLLLVVLHRFSMRS